MRRSVLAIAALLTSLIVAAAGGQSADTGSVVGRVKLTTRIKGSALPSTAYPTRAVGGSDTHAMPQIRNVQLGPCHRPPITIVINKLKYGAHLERFPGSE